MVTAEVSANMIDSFCKEHDVTAGSFLQAVFAETLRRITWEQDILYATVSSGRMEDVNLLNSMGMYVRTLPVVISGDDLKDSTSVEYIKY